MRMLISACSITVLSKLRKRGKTVKYRAISENHLYSKAYSKGRRFVCRSLAVYILNDYAAERLRRANPEKVRINRIGLTVSKKLGGAVVRNRVKRIIREAFLQIDKERGIRTGYLIVIAAREAAVDMKTQEIKRDLLYLLRKLNMLQ